MGYKFVSCLKIYTVRTCRIFSEKFLKHRNLLNFWLQTGRCSFCCIKIFSLFFKSERLIAQNPKCAQKSVSALHPNTQWHFVKPWFVLQAYKYSIDRWHHRTICFPCYRWSAFCEIRDETNTAVRVTDGDAGIKLRRHIGAAHYVSVTSGFRCVDFRKFYLPYGAKNGKEEMRPIQKGTALRFVLSLIELMQSIPASPTLTHVI